MHTKTVLTLIIAAALLPVGAAEAEPETAPEKSPASGEFLFVSFELGEIVATTGVDAVLAASFRNATADTTVSAASGDRLHGSLSLPAAHEEGEWTLNLTTTTGDTVLAVSGLVSGGGIRILSSHVDTDRVKLPAGGTSLRVVQGHVTATVTLVGELAVPDCCTATLGIDADADANVTAEEKVVVNADGHEVRAVMDLEHAAPTVPYVFTVHNEDGEAVARASGVYSFTRLNEVSASGEFDPEFVSYVTGSVDRTPHLVKHDISASILLQTVTGSAREESGPSVFFSMGTPQETGGSGSGPKDAGGSDRVSALTERAMSLATGPVFLAVLTGSFAAAVIAFVARRVLERAS